MRNFLVLILSSILFYSPAYADDVEVPEEELARESVLPVFDRTRAVLNRNVITNKRVELGVGAGLEINEPFYNDAMFNLQGTYNFSEVSAFNLQGLMWMDGLSSYGEQLKNKGCATCQPFDPGKAPHPVWAVMANYQFIAYYGKISVSKTSVMNLNLFALAGIGYVNLDETGTVAFNLGFGQNFFITNNVGLRFDMRWFMFQGPDATTQQLTAADNPPASAFGNTFHYNAQLGLSLVFIL